MTDSALGGKLRAVRRKQGMTQVELARLLQISPSYLNLIERNRRQCPAELLVRLAEVLPLDVKALSAQNDQRLITELFEVFSDPILEGVDVIAPDVREIAAAYPTAG